MARSRRWPTPEEVRDKAERYILDDRKIAQPPYDLTDEEILGRPESAKQPARKPVKRPARKKRAS